MKRTYPKELSREQYDQFIEFVSKETGVEHWEFDGDLIGKVPEETLEEFQEKFFVLKSVATFPTRYFERDIWFKDEKIAKTKTLLQKWWKEVNTK